MAKLSEAEIRTVAITIIQQHSAGIRYRQLLQLILDQHPETPSKTVEGAIWDLEKRVPQEVSKPRRGLYVPIP